MRDIIFSLIVLGVLPVCYRRPLIGLLMFSWLAYMRTQDLCWGFARRQRWSFLIAVVTLAGYVSSRESRPIRKDITAWVMVGLVVWVGLSIVMGEVSGPHQWKRYLEYCKIIGIALFTTAVVVRKEHLRVLMWVIGLSFGFYGIKYGLAGVLSFGGVRLLQGPGGMLADNNDFSLAMCMGLPILIQVGQAEKNRILRRGTLMLVPLVMLTIVMTHSRGGFLSLCALLSVMVWRSRNRVAAITIGVIVGVIGLIFAPASFKERIGTLKNYEEDGSAMGRITAWKIAIRMASANPVFGVGMMMFQRHYMKYTVGGDSHKAEKGRVAHNAYLQIWAECGTPALLMYLFLIFWSFWRIWKLRKAAQRMYYTSWIINYCTMFETSLVAFTLGSTFLNRAHFDLFYHFVAIVTAFEYIAREEMGRLGERAVKQTATGEVVARPPVGFGRLPGPGGFRDAPAWGGRA